MCRPHKPIGNDLELQRLAKRIGSLTRWLKEARRNYQRRRWRLKDQVRRMKIGMVPTKERQDAAIAALYRGRTYA